MSQKAVAVPMVAEDADAVVTVTRARHEGSEALLGVDWVAREEPLEIQVGGASLAVVMRTPGHDEDLALGLLFAEQVIRSDTDVVSLRHASVVPVPEAEGNVLRVTLARGLRVDLERLRRNLYASASCGLCGKTTIAAALAAAPPLDDPARFPIRFFHGLPERLAAGQESFARTGGMHAAGLLAADGTLLVVREDVGRHNAVDKVVGWALRERRVPLSGHVLLVSGRVSYEIAQKALAARIPVVAAVSAPSSLAVELARRAGMTLVAFLRGTRCSVYGAVERVVGGGRP